MNIKKLNEDLDSLLRESADPEYTVLYRVRETDEPAEPYEFNNYNDAKEYYDQMKIECPEGMYVQLNKLNKQTGMYDDICNTYDEEENEDEIDTFTESANDKYLRVTYDGKEVDVYTITRFIGNVIPTDYDNSKLKVEIVDSQNANNVIYDED